jgi:hypothetical protein
MRINLIYNLYELNGAYTSFEDLFYNLRKYTSHDVRFIILYKNKNIFLRFKEYLAFGNGIVYIQIAKMNKDGSRPKEILFDIKGDINIISSEIIHLDLENRIKLSADKTMLFYPAMIYKQEAKDKTQYNYEMQYISSNQVIPICNSYNAKFFENPFVWDMKFSTERINRMKLLNKNQNELLVAEDYYKAKMQGHNIKPFTYQTYKYFRYDKKSESNCFDKARYYENIGKLVIEFVLFGKESIYLPLNKKFNDGMTEFMCSLGYDDEQQYLFTDKDKPQIENSIYMKSNDVLLDLF